MNHDRAYAIGGSVMADKFTDAELAVIKRFMDRACQEFLGENEGITGYDEDGVTVKEWETEWSYGDSYLTSSGTFIPWIAFTDPDEHDRQIKAEDEKREREYEASRKAAQAHREAEERAAYERLKAKYERA